ncbi:MAG: histidine kinase dimerization/phospho-acceptor domain-containing protein [Candidatus Binatia bacterium]
MKRILVVDESQAVRETLALILGRDFTVIQRSSLPKDRVPLSNEEVDLLILGLSPGQEPDPSILVTLGSRVPVPVLFLVDSGVAMEAGEAQGQTDFLVKPFNPYELREKVGKLSVQHYDSLDVLGHASLKKVWARRYLDFPYVPAYTSALAKRYALTSFPILVQGEVGCGQERITQALYSLSATGEDWISIYTGGVTGDHLLSKITERFTGGKTLPQKLTLFLSGLEKLNLSAQSSLLAFLEEEEDKGKQFRILSNSQANLLEKVYKGEFLDVLYYRLAMLTLRLPPLRERRNELPVLAVHLARDYGERLHLGRVSFAPEAIDRLCNYLWFGNLNEMEAVIARTLATHRKDYIEATDLVLGLEEETPFPMPPAEIEEPGSEGKKGGEASTVRPLVSFKGKETRSISTLGNGGSSDVRIFISELAHELKNPMVTIKTFAQLLGDRFDDAAFRDRFQETVGSDIQRMDELLDTILDFSRFTRPAFEKVLLHEQLDGILEEILPERSKREATIQWGKNVKPEEVLADKAQLRYAFKNVFLAVLTQIKPRGEIQIDLEGQGKVAVMYIREGGRFSPFAHYLEASSPAVDEETLPLRVLLAKTLLERNGGGIKVNHLDGDKVLIRTQLPVP